MVKTSELLKQGPWVRSLVGKLGSHMPCGIAKKKKKLQDQADLGTLWIKAGPRLPFPQRPLHVILHVSYVEVKMPLTTVVKSN